MLRLETFYRTDEWRGLVELLKNERTNKNGVLLCEHCGRPIVKKYDCIGHHKIRLTEENVNDVNVSLNPDNVSLVHFYCHNKIHQRFDGYRREVFLVYGSPCAGKTTWVRGVAYQDDLILDVDAIWECLSISDKYHKQGRLKANVFGVRDCVIDQIRTRTGMWRNAYIIGGYPLRTDRDRLCDLLGARPIFIDTPKAECLQRAEGVWKEYVEEWFDAFVT